MDTRLQRCLDGEIRRGELPPDLRERAARWQLLFMELRAGGPSRAPSGLRAEVMDRVRARSS